MSFTSDVNKFVEDFNNGVPEIVQGTAIKLFSGIIKSSPVDEGTFRSNWYVALAQPSSQRNENSQLSESAAINRMTSDVIRLNSTTYTFTNNLPYSEVIEFGRFGDGPKTVGGYSKQAPQGVLRVNVKRFERLFEETARDLQ